MSFDPVRQEELRIMGYSEVVQPTLMAKEIAHDGPVDTTEGRVEAQAGDFLLEFPDGRVEHVNGEDFHAEGWVVLEPEPTPVDGPVELAQPAGLLQAQQHNFSDRGVVGAEATADYCYAHQAFCKPEAPVDA